MPVLRDIPLELNRDEVLRQVGLHDDSKLRPKMERLIDEQLFRVRADHLLDPAIVYEQLSIARFYDDRISLGGSLYLHGSLLPLTFALASDLAVAFCTIGPRLEKEMAASKSKGQLLEASLLDSLGTAAVDILAVEAYHHLRRAVSSHGLTASSPISPGMQDFPISEQRVMAQMAPIERIGVELTSSGMMRPQKTLSMVIGVGAEMPTWTRAEACARCNLAKSCRYKAHGDRD